VQILQALADQMAAAIQNRQIFEHSQQSLANLQQAHAAISQEAWQNLLRARPGQGLRLTAGGHPAQAVGPWLPDMIQAQRSAQLVQEDAFTLALPLKIRQQVAGVLRLSKPRDGRPWSHAEIDLLQTLADRLSAALETARLFEETQRRAERERLTGEITARIRASNDQQAILEIAARELRRALNADRAQLAIQAVRVQPSTSGSEATAPIKEVP
jgi:GAF domain-containing protein